jgi:hypothetical protein
MLMQLENNKLLTTDYIMWNEEPVLNRGIGFVDVSP